MRNSHKLLVLISALPSSYTLASENSENINFKLSGNASLASEYRWRGQTQTKNDTAFQGNFLLNHSSGFYISAFASNVDFGDEAHLELDPFIGYSTSFNIGKKQPTLDVGMLRYNYVGKSDLNYNEYYIKVVLTNLLSENDNFTPSISYTNKYGGEAMSKNLGEDINNWYFNILYTTPFAQSNFGAIANLGYSKANKEIYGGKSENNFYDWKVGTTYNYKPMNLSAELAIIGTNIDTSGFTETNKKGVKNAAVFTLTKYF